MDRRFLLTIIGGSENIEKDLNFIANGDTGVNFVDGRGMFICTFYSPYTTSEIHEKLSHRPAIMLFDITDTETYGINLPTKYYLGIFPETQKILDNSQNNFKTKVKKETTKNTKKVEPQTVVEEFETVNEILDKLSRNSYDRSCLTEKEIEILNKG
jgi:hypothetical protein